MKGKELTGWMFVRSADVGLGALKASVFAFVSLALTTSAFAQEQVQVDLLEAPSSLKAARGGEMSPLLLGASLGADRAVALASGGYDSARSGALFDSAAEVRVWGPLALRVGVAYADDTRRMRPSVGGRLQLLRQAAHGVDGSLSSFFKTEGFDETEGEIETTFALGHQFERFYLLGNVAYGQDPEGNERDGELRASILRSQGRVTWGVETRGRSAIGPQHSPHSAVEPRFDAVGGPIVMASLSTFMLFAEVGPSAVKLQGADLRWGVASLGGVGSVF